MKQISVKEFKEQPFDFFHDWALTTVNVNDEHNSMTIGWGGLGVLYRKDVVTVYIRENRYSYHLFEDCEYFTVSIYNKEYKDALTIYGTKSGRDGNKDLLTGFHPIKLDNAVSYEEASLILVCKKVYQAKLDEDKFTTKLAEEFYQNNDDGTRHHMYIGEIISIYKK